MKKSAKKSQMEIMGLAIIMMLISVGALFYLVFALRPQSADVKKTFVHSELASNTLNAVLKVSTNCKGKSVLNLVIECTSSIQSGCDGASSCDKAKQVIDASLSKALKPRKLDYEFTSVRAGVQNPLISINSTGGSGIACRAEKETATQPISLIPFGAGLITMSVCQN